MRREREVAVLYGILYTMQGGHFVYVDPELPFGKYE